MLQKLALIGLMAFVSGAYAHCPPREGEPGVTYRQVMIQFGRAVRAIDQVVRQGRPQVEGARAQVVAAKACADLYANDSEHKPHPIAVQSLTNEQQVEYLQHHQVYMQNFSALLEEALSIFCELPVVSDETSLLRRLAELEKNLLRVGDEAHKDLFSR